MIGRMSLSKANWFGNRNQLVLPLRIQYLQAVLLESVFYKFTEAALEIYYDLAIHEVPVLLSLMTQLASVVVKILTMRMMKEAKEVEQKQQK